MTEPQLHFSDKHGTDLKTEPSPAPKITDVLLVSSSRALEVAGTAERSGVVEVFLDDEYAGAVTTTLRTDTPDRGPTGAGVPSSTRPDPTLTWRVTLAPRTGDGGSHTVTARLRAIRGSSVFTPEPYGTDGEPNPHSEMSAAFTFTADGVPTPDPGNV